MDFFPTIPLPLLSFSWVFFISSTLILQMANTRNRNNNNGDNNGENNQNVNLPPPPPPTLEQVLAIQAQMLQTMQQTMVNKQAAQPQVLPPPLRYRLGDFQCTKHNLPIALLRCKMIVSSPRGDMPTRQLCLKVNLKIRG
jgi:hypothetical protein